MKLLIDDYIVYKACSAAEDEIDWGDDVIMVVSRFSEALICKHDLTKIKDAIPFHEDVILFFSSPDNFRKNLPKLQGINRKKPCGYKRLSGTERKL